MPIFLDTGNLREIDRFLRMGIIRGVTTNPTILLKDGVAGGLKGVKERSAEIARMIAPYPLSVEVTSNDPQKMVEQAQELSALAENIVGKLESVFYRRLSVDYFKQQIVWNCYKRIHFRF